MRWHLLHVHALSKVGRDEPIGGPRVEKVEGGPVPRDVAPMFSARARHDGSMQALS